MEKREFKVSASGVRLDVFLTEKMPEFSRSHITNIIKEKSVFINGVIAVKCGALLKAGDAVSAEIKPLEKLSLEAEDIPLEILFEDEFIAVVLKPQGMVVHPAAGNKSGTLVNALLSKISDLSGINGVERPGIVHRLDKNTSGLLVVAKCDEAGKSIQRQLAARTARRIYRAIVCGNVKEDAGTISAPIGRNPKNRKLMAVVAGGREAITEYRVLSRTTPSATRPPLPGGECFTYVEFELKTGRTHQIRVHSKHIGHIVAGDTDYGDGGKLWAGGQLLHAYRLVINHPKTGEPMEFTAPLPDYFQKVLQKLFFDLNM